MTAMVTPFYENGEIDYDKAARLATYLVEQGADSIVVAGTTGESPTLSEDEKVQLFRTVAKALKGKAKVLAGTGTNSTLSTIKLTKLAEECGVDGIMLVVPYYNKPSQTGLYRHFSAVAAQTSLPVMLYNVPGRTVANMTSDTTLQLAQIPNIVAVKEASGDLEQIARIRAGAPDDFVIYSGDDGVTLPVLAVGGVGVVSVASHVAGKELKEMISAFHAGDIKTALSIHLRLLPLYKALFLTTSPTPVKGAMNMLGHDLGSVRLPLVELSDQEHAAIKTALVELGYL
jgi:4-hydroxy-tetrahydrodipicolinate synthase